MVSIPEDIIIIANPKLLRLVFEIFFVFWRGNGSE